MACVGGRQMLNFSRLKSIYSTSTRAFLSTRGRGINRTISPLASAVNLDRKMSAVARPKVYVTRRLGIIPQSGIDLLQKAQYEISQWNGDDPVPREELLQNIHGKDALFCLLTDKIDKDILDAAGPQLKVIATMSVGFDHLDMKEIQSRGILVGYTPDVLTDATAELTVSLLLATARRLPEGLHAVKAGLWGTWQPLWLCGSGLQGSTVGMVGLGRIGLAVAKRIKPFNISRLLYCGNTPKNYASEIEADFVDFDTLLRESDFVIVCCAFNSQTKGLFNKEAFSKMKKSAIFVNTSRGGVVNQEDLVLALQTGEIRAAGLDVTTPEPLPTNSPLLKLDNCVVLPHIGSATEEARSDMSLLTAKNIIAGLSGKPMPAPLTV